MYRLYVDEVGTDDLTHTEKEHQRYLSLTGVAMKVDHARDFLEPSMNWIKAKVLKHDPDDPIILHRSDIMNRRGGFECLGDDETRDLFDRAVLRLMQKAEYRVITALVDKQWMLKQQHWAKTHPYHWLMEIMLEKYVQFLEREKDIGDVMPESRGGSGKGKVDERLQKACEEVRASGTFYVSKDRIASAIRASHLKFRKKKDNVAGLQLCDLLAHPSHLYVRERMKHPVEPGPFCRQVQGILTESKYDRSKGGAVTGYGIKHLPE